MLIELIDSIRFSAIMGSVIIEFIGFSARDGCISDSDAVRSDQPFRIEILVLILKTKGLAEGDPENKGVTRIDPENKGVMSSALESGPFLRQIRDTSNWGTYAFLKWK